jgi:hypothetical protein
MERATNKTSSKSKSPANSSAISNISFGICSSEIKLILE